MRNILSFWSRRVSWYYDDRSNPDLLLPYFPHHLPSLEVTKDLEQVKSMEAQWAAFR